MTALLSGWQHYFRYPLAWDPPWQSTFFTGAWVDTLALAYSWLVWLPSWYRRPIVNRLRASGRNWFRTIVMINKNPKGCCFFVCFKEREKKKKKFSMLSSATLCWAVKCGRSQLQMDGEKPVTRPETDVGSELTLTYSCPSWSVLTTDFTPRHQRDRGWAREGLIKAFN